MSEQQLSTYKPVDEEYEETGEDEQHEDEEIENEIFDLDAPADTPELETKNTDQEKLPEQGDTDPFREEAQNFQESKDEGGKEEFEIFKAPNADHALNATTDDGSGGSSEDSLLAIKPSQAILSIVSTESVDIANISIHTAQEAAPIAEQIIEQIEAEVFAHFNIQGILPPGYSLPATHSEILKRLRESYSGDSIGSENLLVGEPSLLEMEFEVGEEGPWVGNALSKPRKPKDESIQVKLHRVSADAKVAVQPSKKPRRSQAFAQTRNMALLPDSQATNHFMELYPLIYQDAIHRPVPSRQKSLMEAVAKAETEDPNIDQMRKGPQITHFFNRKKILPPLREDYYKDETFWTGSRFRGEYRNRQFFKGSYTHPTGVQYESEWKDGHFHTTNHRGVVMYPRGDKIEGVWFKGRFVKGELTLGDGLKYEPNWQYCEGNDRMFRVERYFGMKPAGDTIYNDQFPNLKLPPGCYDTGDGIYYPSSREIRGFDGFVLRIAEQQEHEWILANCRKSPTAEEEYIPSFHEERLPGSFMEKSLKYSVASVNVKRKSKY